ncbi:hypothetical protein [Nitrobacter sp. TKz-YC02]|uniref:hypothetical protein n=1 Tax=Nitrobacter sp. TKz-YC02 TaxID=3398704 RepID=UPI003CF180D3
MRRKISWGLALSALGLAAVAAGPIEAQEAATPPACAAPVAPTGELEPWTTPFQLKAADTETTTSQSRLPVGQAASLTLLRTPDVRYPRRPEKPGGSVSYGGLVLIYVHEAGTYRVALDSVAWIDLVRDEQAVKSTAHGHGPNCTGIRKMVDYPLTPGPYVLQISANGRPQMTMLLARLP